MKTPADVPGLVILGGGQLARMMIAAAARLGLSPRVYQREDTGACDCAGEVRTSAWDDAEALRTFLHPGDVLTLDHESIDLTTVRSVLPDGAVIRPGAQTMHWIADKIRQKKHAEEAGLPVGPYVAATTPEELKAAAERFGYPVMLKRPHGSYDGFGNWTVKTPDDLAEGHAKLGGGTMLVEAWVPFKQEVAVIVARRPGGASVVYPVAATYQRNHQCEAVEVPAAIDPAIAAEAQRIAVATADAFDCIGAVGVELFMLEDGSLLLNELAPRPHNTGHYTIDACHTSQFENHLRGVLDLPLGDPSLIGPAAAMVNVVGSRAGETSHHTLAAALDVPGAAVHLYGKRTVRPGRKMGHVTALGKDVATARALATDAAGKLEL
ncbi:MAG: 5-(carboxyamino)imidazole ribonucleotide synthase [Myxococcota bacterium]